MSEQENKKLTDLLPLKKHSFEMAFNDGICTYPAGKHDFYLVSEVEAFLEKLVNPKNIMKLTTAMVMKKPLDLEELLK